MTLLKMPMEIQLIGLIVGGVLKCENGNKIIVEQGFSAHDSTFAHSYKDDNIINTII